MDSQQGVVGAIGAELIGAQPTVVKRREYSRDRKRRPDVSDSGSHRLFEHDPADLVCRNPGFHLPTVWGGRTPLAASGWGVSVTNSLLSPKRPNSLTASARAGNQSGSPTTA